MYNSPIYLFVLFSHIIATVIGFGAVLVIDTFGLLWVLKLGVPMSLVRRVAQVTQRLIWLGWVLAVISGAILLVMKGAGINSLTTLKLFLVFMLGVNGIFLHTIKKSMDQLPQLGESVPAIVAFRIGLASFISQVGWWGAMIIGFLNREVKPAFPYEPWLFIIGFLLIVSIAAVIGEIVTRPKVHLTHNPRSTYKAT